MDLFGGPTRSLTPGLCLPLMALQMAMMPKEDQGYQDSERACYQRAQ
jgi:hypothetical protein